MTPAERVADTLPAPAEDATALLARAGYAFRPELLAEAPRVVSRRTAHVEKVGVVTLIEIHVGFRAWADYPARREWVRVWLHEDGRYGGSRAGTLSEVGQ